MDKSFNDLELSDIMKEIEALEEDFTTQSEPENTTSLEIAAKSDENVILTDQVIKIQEDIEEARPQITSFAIDPKNSNVVPLESARPTPKTSSGQTSMSFNVQGSLTLGLQFNISGKTVSLEVTEAGLSIEMEGGVKFTVPVGEQSSLKKAV